MTKAAEILRTLATYRSAEYDGRQELPLRLLKRRSHAEYTRKWSLAAQAYAIDRRDNARGPRPRIR